MVSATCGPTVQLQRVITDFVLNACEALSSVSGRTDVKSLRRRERMDISIADNGPGVPGPIRHAVFQPIVSCGKTGGTGLGLAIVQKIVRDLVGRFTWTGPVKKARSSALCFLTQGLAGKTD
jgi:nitrogen-specific signal transduction histidine kinase